MSARLTPDAHVLAADPDARYRCRLQGTLCDLLPPCGLAVLR